MNKYNAKKVVVNGIVFDSKKEERRYKELVLLERAGKINGLRRQVEFTLIPAYYEPDTVGPRGGIKKGKVIERECSYVADFVYVEDGKVHVEDVKGYRNGGAYNIFVIKRKLMLHVHGIVVNEV